jgi:hypothetical protein
MRNHGRCQTSLVETIPGCVCQLAVPDTIAPGYLEDAINYEIDVKGSLAPRTGFRLTPSAAAAANNPALSHH